MDSQAIGRWLIGAGIILALAGGLVVMLGRLPWVGRLPGDILIKKEHFTFYFPIVTCIVLSLVLNLLMRVFRR